MTKWLALPLLVSSLLVAAVAAGLLARGEQAYAQSRLLAVDADPTAGAINSCRSVSLNDAFTIDFVFKDAPPMFGPEFDLTYNGAVLRIESVDAATTSSLFLTKNGSTAVSNFSDTTPDSDGTFHAAAFDLDLTGPSGDGAVIRLNVTAIGSGTSSLTISNPSMLDVNGSDVTATFAFQNGEIRVDSACPAAPAAVGGTTEFLVDRTGAPADLTGGSGLGAAGYAAIAGGAAAAALTLAASGWFVGRRLRRSGRTRP